MAIIRRKKFFLFSGWRDDNHHHQQIFWKSSFDITHNHDFHFKVIFWMVVEMFLLLLLLLLDRLVFIIRNEKKSKIFFYLDFSYKIRWQGRQENLFNFLAENFSFFVLLDIDFFFVIHLWISWILKFNLIQFFLSVQFMYG